MKNRKKKGIYEKCVKRIFDVFFACVLIFLLLPIFLLTALLVRIKLGKPVIFKQARGGKNGDVFHIYKFRTMTDSRGEDGTLLPDSERLTRFGAWLRATSIDELPQLLNIIKGEMSFVGPRPQLAEFLPDYTEFEMRRHEVRPGLTGPAQVNGRNTLPWNKRFKLDVEYVDNLSLAFDLRILALTLRALFSGSGKVTEDLEDFYDREK